MLMQGSMRFDKRIIERNVKSGVVTEEEVKKHFKELKDLSEEAMPMESQLVPVDHPVPGRRLEEEEDL